jgi:asparagine synthetase B (glutamine-hydrolysing)
VDFFQAYIAQTLNIAVQNSLKNSYLLLIMCVIFFYKYLSGQKVDVDKMSAYFNRIKHRGPDKSVSELLDDNTFIGFHRLAINGLTEMGDQPFIYEKESGAHVYVICNGEIYNYRDLNEVIAQLFILFLKSLD